MSSDAAGTAPQFENEPLALPFGITESGETLSALNPADWKRSQPPPTAVLDRGREKKMMVFAEGVEPNNLASAGWGLVFARDADPAVKESLSPLIEHRRKQVNSDILFQVFDGTRAVRPGELARPWVVRHNADFMEVEPSNGVPLYLTLVGSPREIPFEFQYTLDSYWNVGRLDFDKPEDYARYADSVIEYETAESIANKKSAVLWNVKNPGDTATGLLHNLVAQPLLNGQGANRPLGAKGGFTLQPLLAEAATKSALLDVLQAGTASLLFTGSHGMAFPRADEAARRERQGALLCQDWSAGMPIQEGHYLTGDEVRASANAKGLIHFLFACYGGGCPKVDDYRRDMDDKPVPLMANPVTARLPQAMLQKGALAVLAHVDRAWSYSFQAASGRGQYQGFRSVMDRILNGDRIGQATDAFNQRWGSLSGQLADLIQRKRDEPIPDSALTNLWVERNDARNYIILGDPAVRLRVDKLG